MRLYLKQEEIKKFFVYLGNVLLKIPVSGCAISQVWYKIIVSVLRIDIIDFIITYEVKITQYFSCKTVYWSTYCQGKMSRRVIQCAISWDNSNTVKQMVIEIKVKYYWHFTDHDSTVDLEIQCVA